MDSSEPRKALWRQVIAHLERDPELFGLVLTSANLSQPQASLAFDDARYTAARAMADDYLRFGHYEHCGACFYPVALYPSHKLNWPSLTPHKCPETELKRPRVVAT